MTHQRQARRVAGGAHTILAGVLSGVGSLINGGD